MIRRLFNFLAALSLLVCVAVVALWVRSCFVEDDFVREDDRDEGPGRSVYRNTTLVSSFGGVRLSRGSIVRSGDRDAVTELMNRVRRLPSWISTGWSRHRAYSYPAPAGTHTLGFSLIRNGLDQAYATNNGRILLQSSGCTLTAPYWFFAALTAWSVVPVGLNLRRQIRRRVFARRRLCVQCGYDLRATPGRCPECGTIASATPAG